MPIIVECIRLKKSAIPARPNGGASKNEMVKVWKLYVGMWRPYMRSCTDKGYCIRTMWRSVLKGLRMWWSVFIDFEWNTEYQVDFVWQTDVVCIDNWTTISYIGKGWRRMRCCNKNWTEEIDLFFWEFLWYVCGCLLSSIFMRCSLCWLVLLYIVLLVKDISWV